MSGVIRVLVVDDHDIVREGLRAMLETKPDIEVVGEAADGIQAEEMALRHQPDVILMDLMMPRKNGIRATHDIKAKMPGARILVLSSFSDDAQIVESIHAGASGYLLKTAKLNELTDAIRQVNNGQAPLNSVVAQRIMAGTKVESKEPQLSAILTRREKTVLPLVVRGMTNKEIGDTLKITPRTVGTHIGNMIKKAGVENRVQLSMLAVRQGLSSLYGDE